MEIDPKHALEIKERQEEMELEQDRSKIRLNTIVALTIALVATFMGVCKIKDQNIVIHMEKAQASKIDTWAFYQARNIREDLYRSTSDQLAMQAKAGPAALQVATAAEASRYAKLADSQQKKKGALKTEAEGYDTEYERLHSSHRQFDLEEGALAIAVSLFAITSLTQKKWMYGVGLVPAILGIAMGLAGLLGLGLKPEALMRLLG
ncbi:MAG: DUF4337 domain-containing protein [Fimbriimonas ginsengisoli]|uniref:DUF4337 domain-containing protein n=1 Tax=Fimbriimonas ginsengisoli TaxID=1005039 RepID=A0A931LTL3_FIMGI|nr:DUF4337 domain-containing protein [Fimbriimonas ginsengisoli]MBI3722092.1 DUF4337 domain-containing protein [Fimbriimonas ginsengisoli]